MSIYQHFRQSEHVFVDQVLSWVEQVERSFSPYVTDFLDPREQQIITTLIGTNNEDIKVHFFGGYEQSERKKACIAPFYEEVNTDSFGIVLLEGVYPDKFITLEHKDILGTLMSLGIERKTVGDILLTDGSFQFFINGDIVIYVQANMTKVKKASIQLSTQSFDQVIKTNDQWIERGHTVSSLRLDVLIKEIYQISRQNAAQYIKQNKVKVNFKQVDDPALQLMEQDLISVRGLGRSKLLSLEGITRKNKHRVMTAKLKE